MLHEVSGNSCKEIIAGQRKTMLREPGGGAISEDEMKRRCRKAWLGAIFLGWMLGFPVSVEAEGQVAAETAKIATEDAPTVAAGELEVEAQYARREANRSFDANGSLESRKAGIANEVGVKATYGFMDDFDGSLGCMAGPTCLTQNRRGIKLEAAATRRSDLNGTFSRPRNRLFFFRTRQQS